MNKKLNDKYLRKMKELEYNDDTEHVHSVADDILCDLLIDLGYTELVGVFCDLEKWYA